MPLPWVPRCGWVWTRYVLNINDIDSWGNNNYTASRLTYCPNLYANMSSDVSIYPWLFSSSYPIAKDDTRRVCLVLFQWGTYFLFSINTPSSDASLIQITLCHMNRPSDCNINVTFSTLWGERLIHYAKRSFLKQDDWSIYCWPNDNLACTHCGDTLQMLSKIFKNWNCLWTHLNLTRMATNYRW